jgi:single stranded DNA-binding protein
MTNLVILVGRIARDPETRTTQSGSSITSISVVTDRPARNKEGKTYKDENGYTAKDSEFHRVTCFNGLGQNVAKYCTKGSWFRWKAGSIIRSGKMPKATSATAAKSTPTRSTS